MRRGFSKSPPLLEGTTTHNKHAHSVAGCPCLSEEQCQVAPLKLYPLFPVEYGREGMNYCSVSFYFHCGAKAHFSFKSENLTHTRKCVFSLCALSKQTVLGELLCCRSPEICFQSFFFQHYLYSQKEKRDTE